MVKAVLYVCMYMYMLNPSPQFSRLVSCSLLLACFLFVLWLLDNCLSVLGGWESFPFLFSLPSSWCAMHLYMYIYIHVYT